MRRRVLSLLLVTAVAAGCGPADPPAPDDPTPAPSTVSPSPDEPSPTGDASPTSDASPSASPTADASPSPLAGEPFDGPPVNGQPAVLIVVGVAAGDVLYVRAGPGIGEPVVTELAPLATDVDATGRARLLPGSIWLELATDAGTGWANSRYLAFLGPTDDITSQLVAATGSLPRAETMADLGRDVGALRASEDPPSRIVLSAPPSVGDLGEVTVDVIGLGDDAQVGERLVVFATVAEDGFTVRTVEATQLCGRGPGGEEGCP